MKCPCKAKQNVLQCWKTPEWLKKLHLYTWASKHKKLIVAQSYFHCYTVLTPHEKGRNNELCFAYLSLFNGTENQIHFNISESSLKFRYICLLGINTQNNYMRPFFFSPAVPPKLTQTNLNERLNLRYCFTELILADHCFAKSMLPFITDHVLLNLQEYLTVSSTIVKKGPFKR